MLHHILGIPLDFWYGIVIMLIMFYVLTFTPFGQRSLFVGQSREVARLSGFKVSSTRFWAFVVGGFIAAIGGVLSDGVLGTATPQNQGPLLLSIYAAAFLGMTTIQPGRFNAIGAGISVFFLAVAVNGMNLLGAQTYVQQLFYGVDPRDRRGHIPCHQQAPRGIRGQGDDLMAAPAVSQGLAAILGLRQLIMDGELRAGDRLSEVRLAARLEVSRTPLRLALAQLEHEGLLEPVPGGGFVVRSFSGRQVVDAIELRGLLEGQAARLAAVRNNGPRALGELVACVAKLDRIVGGNGGPPGRPRARSSSSTSSSTRPSTTSCSCSRTATSCVTPMSACWRCRSPSRASSFRLRPTRASSSRRSRPAMPSTTRSSTRSSAATAMRPSASRARTRSSP